MRVEIDIDMGKIDYDSINAQIKEKLEEMSAEDIFSRYYTTDEDVRKYIEKYLDEGSHDYVVNQGWWSKNYEATNKINKMAEDIVSEMLTTTIDKIFKTMPEDELQKLMYELIPKIFVDTLYRKMAGYLYSEDGKFMCQTDSICRNIVDQAFRERII